MKTKAIILTIMLACFVTAKGQPNFSFGQTHEKSIESKILKHEKKYCIYLPAGYQTNTDKKYPVLYLLHGMGDNFQGWRDNGKVTEIANQLMASGESREMIIVMPDAGTEQNGYFNMEGWRYEDFFFQEFIPHIEKEYRVIADKQHRAIAGLSMGGGGSVGYAQHHPDMFSSVYAMSAWLGANDSRRNGSDDTATDKLVVSYIKNNCITFLNNADDETKEKMRSMRWFIDVGDDDFLFDLNMEFVQSMRKSRIPYQLRVRDGGHNFTYWRGALFLALPFVSNGMENRE